jgi:SAM-dependent methyltransferase
VSQREETDRPTSDWWRSFFQGPAVKAWLRATTEAQTRAEVDMLLRVLGHPDRARILDVPCGQGRHAVELAGRNCEVTGVDFSAEFLGLARDLALRKGVNVDWEERDMRDLPWRSTFDGACCFGNSFGYMDDQENERFLAAVARALKPGGRFVVEAGAAVAEVVLPSFQESRWFDHGDVLFLLRNRYHHVEGIVETEFSFVTEGRVERRVGYQRLYGYRELCGLCRRAGFGEVDCFAGVGGEPFRLGATRLLVVATREC